LPTASCTLSLHDALPICFFTEGPGLLPGIVPPPLRFAGKTPTRKTLARWQQPGPDAAGRRRGVGADVSAHEPAHRVSSPSKPSRSEEHTSELQSLRHLVC